MVHGAIIRTFAQQDVLEFAQYSGIPTINALTDDEHPCQILADLLTIQETLGGWEGRKIAFIGDGFSNMTRSWMWAAKHLGFELAIASPASCQPSAEFLTALDASNVSITSDPMVAAQDAHVINTDVWLSMGQEDQSHKEREFTDFELNTQLLARAVPDHIVLHCLPAYRGKEISDEILERHAATIFQQAENRLHTQKAILVALAHERRS
jgi:ornithine carbamoyltransferase